MGLFGNFDISEYSRYRGYNTYKNKWLGLKITLTYPLDSRYRSRTVYALLYNDYLLGNLLIQGHILSYMYILQVKTVKKA